MRITIDLSEDERRSTSVLLGATKPPAAEDPATDGGAAPVSLLMALGASGPETAEEQAPDPVAPDRQGIDAGGPPEWLTGVIEGGR